MVKAACSAGDLGSIPGSGRSPGEGSGNPHQYSCLENPMEGGAWQALVYGVTKSQTQLSDFTFFFFFFSCLIHTISVFIRFDRVPEELGMEVQNIVQEAVTKKCRKAKRLSEEALQVAEERRELKGKGERKSYTQLNTEYQRIARIRKPSQI